MIGKGNPDAINYGRKFWHVRTPDAYYMLCADRIEITASGALIAHGSFKRKSGDTDEPAKPEQALMILAPGQWEMAHAASFLDGHAVCVDSSQDRKPAASAAKKARGSKS